MVKFFKYDPLLTSQDASPGSSAQFSNTTPESNPNTDRDSAMEALYHRNSMLEQENAELLANKTENDVIKLKLAELRARMTEAVFRNFGDEGELIVSTKMQLTAATEAAPLPAKRAGSSTPGPSAHDVQIPEERPMKRRSTRTRRTAA